MKKILSVLFILALFFSSRVYSQYEVQEAIQNLDHNLTTTTQVAQPTETINEGDNVVDEITLQDLDFDDVEKSDPPLKLLETLSFLGCLVKVKAKEHFKNYGKWYLVGIVGAAGAISAYYYFHPHNSESK